MVWNLDYNISAWFVCFVLIIYYTTRRNLPIRRNYAFLMLMVISLSQNTLDIIGSVVASFPQLFSVKSIYFWNIWYYIALGLCPYAFVVFCTLIISKRRISHLVFICESIPFLLVMICSIMTPWTHFVFFVNDQGLFEYGPGRIVFFMETTLYLLIGFFYISIWGPRTTQIHHRISLYAYIVVVLIGHIFQVFLMPYHQTVSLCSMISILVVFLTFQGPDYYRERRTGFFDARGLQLVLDENYLHDCYLPTAGFVIENYSALKSAYTEDVISSVLRDVSAYLRTLSGKQPAFYLRNGAFILMLDNKTNQIELKEHIQNRFEEPFYFRNNAYYLHPRFFYDEGIIHYANYEEYRATIITALAHNSKHSGATVIRMTQAIYDAAQRVFAVEQALDEALRTNSMQIYFQPIYSIEKKRIISAEALARIYDPKLGLLMPDEFIPIAERNGNINRLGEQVFTKVCQFIRSHNMDILGLDYIEVNLSPIQCRRSNTGQRYIEIMNHYNINPSYINLEITETEDYSENEYTYQNIELLSNNGVRFSLDDYGSGYSNLINTITLPFSIIKIDKSIVWAYFDGQSHILRHLIHHFGRLGKEVIAEGIETQAQRDSLTEMGCHHLQGFLYSKPLQEQDFLSYIKTFEAQ